MVTKIAIPTDEGETISRHFGQAAYFKVVDVVEGRTGEMELREKASHRHGDHSHADGDHPGQRMVAEISDCQVLISGGMGTPVLERAREAGLHVLLTRETSIARAVEAYLNGSLENDPRLIHQHPEGRN